MDFRSCYQNILDVRRECFKVVYFGFLGNIIMKKFDEVEDRVFLK